MVFHEISRLGFNFGGGFDLDFAGFLLLLLLLLMMCMYECWHEPQVQVEINT